MSSVVIAGNTSGSITISAPDVSGSNTLTLPVATDTLVGKATTDTLTNKTLVAPTITGNLTTTGNTILGDASTDTLNVGNGGLVKDASGNVGIGTASPDAKLELTVGDNGGINIEQSGSSQTGYLTFRDSDGGLDGRVSYDHSNNSMRFTTATTERMRIDSSGNLLVGTTSVLGKQTNSYDGVTAFGLALANTASGTASQIAIRFMRNGSDIGSVTTTNVATAYNTSSDYRLKNTIAPMVGALGKVALLKPVTYKWNADGSDGQGFIAHELAEVEPGCVTGEKDAVDAEGNPKYQGIDTSFLVATLTAAIQEQQALIIQLQADVAALKALSA